MSTYDVYREVALRSVDQYQNLEVFCHAWQTAHWTSSWSSWIPKWDVPGSYQMPHLLPFLYKADFGSSFSYAFNSSTDSLLVQGNDLGTIAGTACVLNYQSLNAQCAELEGSGTKATLLLIMRLITQDRWQQLSIPSTYNATRSGSKVQDQFARFCSFLLHILEERKADVFHFTRRCLLRLM